jgi:hypothetical protein
MARFLERWELGSWNAPQWSRASALTIAIHRQNEWHPLPIERVTTFEPKPPVERIRLTRALGLTALLPVPPARLAFEAGRSVYINAHK